jgi:NADH-quinone oxidoreductase subunit M
MGYVTLGMAVMTVGDPRYYAFGVDGAMFMMLAHGITSTGMFFLVGVIYERAHTRDLKKLGGLFAYMPAYGAVSFLIFFGSMGLPGLCGFIAEAFVILSAFNYNPWLAVFAAAAVILTAGYILWTLQRVFLGRNEQYRGLPDLTARERDILTSIADGHTVRQTARALGIAAKTVENTQARLFRKLGARNRPGALAAAHALGLLDLIPAARTPTPSN